MRRWTPLFTSLAPLPPHLEAVVDRIGCQAASRSLWNPVLDPVVLEGLVGMSEIHITTYQTLTRLGADAPINQFLRAHPMFGDWLQNNLQGAETDRVVHVMTGWHRSRDPLAGLIRIIARHHRGRFPGKPDRAAIRATIEAVMTLSVPIQGWIPIEPETLGFLALAPARLRPAILKDPGHALMFARYALRYCETGDLLTPPAIYRDTTGAWADDTARFQVVIQKSGHRHMNHLARMTYALLWHAHEGQRCDDPYGRLDRDVALIVARRLSLACCKNRGALTLIRASKGLEYPYGTMVGSPILPKNLRSLNARQILDAIGLDWAAMQAFLVDDEELTVRDAEARIFPNSAIDSRSLGKDLCVGSTVFHQAIIGQKTYYARIGPYGGIEITLHPDAEKTFGRYSPKGRVTIPIEDHQAIAEAFHREFGYAVETRDGRHVYGYNFYGSQTAQKLREWVARKPRLAYIVGYENLCREAFDHPFIGDWYAWAISRSPGHDAAAGFDADSRSHRSTL